MSKTTRVESPTEERRRANGKHPRRATSLLRRACASVLLLAGACQSSSPDTTGGETHFLEVCSDNPAVCGSEFSCVCNVCTLPCEDDTACSALPGARCVASVPEGCSAAAPARTCDVECSRDAECAVVSPEHVCSDGLCRVAMSMAPEERDASVMDAPSLDTPALDDGVLDDPLPDDGALDDALRDATASGSAMPDASVLDAAVPDAGVIAPTTSPEGSAPMDAVVLDASVLDAAMSAPLADASTGAACSASGISGNQVLLLGDSFFATSHEITGFLEQFARDASVLAPGERYRDASRLLGNGLAHMGNGIADQYAGAVAESPASVVIMNGGGADALLGSCDPLNEQCPLVVDAVLAAEDLFERMFDDEVSAVVYAFYPDPQDEAIKARIDLMRPLLSDVCERAAVPCHWLDLRPTFDGHYDEYIMTGGLNPTSAGAEATARTIWAVMQENCIAQ